MLECMGEGLTGGASIMYQSWKHDIPERYVNPLFNPKRIHASSSSLMAEGDTNCIAKRWPFHAGRLSKRREKSILGSIEDPYISESSATIGSKHMSELKPLCRLRLAGVSLKQGCISNSGS